MLPTVWLKPGILIIYGASLDAANHKHNAIQLVWPAGKSLCQLEGRELVGPLIINSQIEHQLSMEAGWVLLIEPQSNLGQQLSERLAQRPAVAISESSSLSTIAPKQGDDPASLLAPFFSMLGLDVTYADTNATTSLTDKRIQQLLSDLDRCLLGDCLKPLCWRASEVASQLALSESRFLHLFREQMGIAWRPYLLWRRTICAISAITKGLPATEAAHLAGFSDSAHLSRTFRSLFGMSIREAKHLIKPA
ncbi:helix-turn-helix transcriptional regulator [Amphritea balenae]|uniref:AraC family transcriptional regulator n=1 Tax=Amphritea balenae TaxID=452629 RepID=A0A3P1SX14_9GAMM|nr:AraC family transcriptional regulator [Amphritea balenae]RRD01598.1 AraC family transcriptional regulator [Amphritea balenae]GGK55652.1 putative transcriptional regulator, AraC family protein [Amphritea balenae]